MRLSDFAIRTLAAIGAIAFLVAAAIHVSTFFPVNADYLTVGVLILVAPMVMVFGGAILALNSRRRIVVPSAGPGLALALGVLGLFVYAGINFFTTRLFGQPEATGGSYFLNAHGFRVPIDRQQYEEAVRLQVRSLSGHFLLFIGVGAALLVATLSQSLLTGSARPALALDLERRRMDVTPRARIYLGMFGVISALVVAYWLVSGSVQGGGPPVWVIAVVAITLFNVVRYWRWITRGRADSSRSHPVERPRNPPGS
ncbi:MAG: hypothetical protein M3O99_08530 [Chloroflexota bacterium]|nr:hypothetical protein [Chloroflexota bacterium]